MEQLDAVIVGGVAGAAMATAPGRYDVSAAVLEKRPATYSTSITHRSPISCCRVK